MPPQIPRPSDPATAPPLELTPAGAPALTGASATGVHGEGGPAALRAGNLDPVRVCARPCGPCPWRRDNAGRKRYGNLPEYAAGTIPGEPGFGEPVDGDPQAALGTLFACHHISSDKPHVCAGHVAVVGRDHALVRLGVIWGLIDPATLEPGEDWPPMSDSYQEMIAAVGPDAPLPPRTELVQR